MSKIIEPHRVISREVTNADVQRVMAEAEKMKQHIQGNCVALAHSQIDDKDPLRFFLIQTGEIIVNATIVRHVDYTVDSIEGCMTYPGAKAVVRQRWHKVDVDFQTIEEGTRLSGRMSKTFRGMQAFIMQHEIDHAEGRYCYDGTEVKMKQASQND